MSLPCGDVGWSTFSGRTHLLSEEIVGLALDASSFYTYKIVTFCQTNFLGTSISTEG